MTNRKNKSYNWANPEEDCKVFFTASRSASLCLLLDITHQLFFSVHLHACTQLGKPLIQPFSNLFWMTKLQPVTNFGLLIVSWAYLQSYINSNKQNVIRWDEWRQIYRMKTSFNCRRIASWHGTRLGKEESITNVGDCTEVMSHPDYCSEISIGD